MKIRVTAWIAILYSKWSPLVILGMLLFTFAYFDLHHYLNLASIKTYQAHVQHWTSENYLAATTLYLLMYSLLIACAIPCATILTLQGGFLFGYLAVLYAVFSTTVGGMILYLSIRTSIGDHIAKKTSGWVKKVEHGFQQHAFSYMLMLRLVPIFPCWLSNISAGLLNVPIQTFLVATVIGVTPATLIYVMAGRSLDKLLTINNTPLVNLILSPSVFFPLLGLAILSLFPVIYKSVKKKH